MFGPALLVNPVTQPMYYAAESAPLNGVSKSRSVYLPKGADWYDFWTGTAICGRSKQFVPTAALDTMPLYVRSGSIVPIGPDITYADEQPNAPLESYAFIPDRAAASLCMTMRAITTTTSRVISPRFASLGMRQSGVLRSIIVREDYPGMPGSREFRVIIGDVPYNQVLSESTSTRIVRYEGQEITIRTLIWTYLHIADV